MTDLLSGDKKKRLLLFRVGFWVSFTANLLFIVLTVIAHFYAVRSGYDWTYWELSELVLYDQTSKLLFDIASMVNGLCLLGALLPIAFYIPERASQISSLVINTLVSTMLFGVGAFPEDIFPVVHYVFGLGFFLMAGIAVGFYSVYFLRRVQLVPIGYSIFGLVTLFLLLFHVATRWFFGMAFTQRLAILAIMVYLLITTAYLYFTKEKSILNQNSLWFEKTANDYHKKQKV